MDKEDIVKEIGFTVDAALITRLGYELVGKAETAVSELIKNAYDADARTVKVKFVDTDKVGKGSIYICDDGLGMTYKQLRDGFMRISSNDKIVNPVSPRFHRSRAGRKGIGRFATQRLGNELIIITQTKDSDKAIKLTLDWNKYKPGMEINSIKFPIEYIEKNKVEGTDLIINGNKDIWNKAAVSRVKRYIVDLFQPDYLSEKKEGENTFDYYFSLISNGEITTIESINNQLSEKALAIFEGEILKDHTARIEVKSEILDVCENPTLINDDGNPILFNYLDNVKFKVYYFIYNRLSYYRDEISAQDLKEIYKLSKTASGIRLYRNGFRVLPYGEVTNDWTNLNHRWSNEEYVVNLPLSTRNVFGYVEVEDKDGKYFEETSSREGLIENEPFKQLSDFINRAISACRRRLAGTANIFHKNESEKDINKTKDITESNPEAIFSMREKIDNLYHYYENFEKYYSSQSSDDEKNKYEKSFSDIKDILNSIKEEIDEIEMLRVLAGIGLSIGEFTHEIKQYKPAINGCIASLSRILTSSESREDLYALKKECDKLFSYTKFFDVSISQNTDRILRPINIADVIDTFDNMIKENKEANGIDIEIIFNDYDLVTIPMHESEWTSILVNLYTNSRKAILRAKVKGRIGITCGIEGSNIYVKFQDNGDGIPSENKDKIFNAFFTTSTPASYNASDNEQLSGTGLGLKIVKDIILSYKGIIKLEEPDTKYKTCFKILIPKN